MKKLALTLITFLCGGSLSALPLGNPYEASLYSDSFWSDVGHSACSLRTGFYGDYLFNRYMQVERNNPDDPFRNIDRVEVYTNAGYLAFNLWDRFDLFTTLGATTLYLQNRDIPFSLTTTSLIDLSFVSEFSWSFGSRITLIDWCQFALGIEGQYFRTDPKLDFLLDGASGTFTYLDHWVTYQSWQVGLGLSYFYALPCTALALVPYLGAFWSDARFDMRNLEIIIEGDPETIPDLEQGKLWGFAIGTTLLLGDVIGVTVEGRFASEMGLYVNGQFRF